MHDVQPPDRPNTRALPVRHSAADSARSALEQHAQMLLRQMLDHPQADFRDGQWDAIQSLVCAQAHMLVVQRTGWGKSLIYFLATRLLRDRGAGPTLLISPLLALMRNQILAAQRIGIRAATINSSNTDDWQGVEAALADNAVDILLISPERLANEAFRSTVLLPVAPRVGLFVVDEAHCISDWGHDFRPDYRRITRVLQALPATVPVLATTATANNRVVADIHHQLGERLQVLRGSLARDSLRLQTIHLPSQAARLAWLARTLPTLPGSGIIYTLTVRDAQQVADWLRLCGIDAHAYYADVEGTTREELESKLLANRIKVLVATTALGMGFDKPDLRFVIHFQRPGSVVHYYQQVGRAGRAVDDAYGILLSGDEDQEITDYFIESAFPPSAHIDSILRVLDTAEHGLTLAEVQGKVNLSQSQIEKVLHILQTEPQSPVSKQGTRWYTTPVVYMPDQAKIERLIQIRRAEQIQMLDYLHTTECLMAFLRRALDDPESAACGRCASCLGQPLLDPTYALTTAQEAIRFLRRRDRIIEPRRRWIGEALACYGWRGPIPAELRAEPGRALCQWGDAGWGDLVRSGKQHAEQFDDDLVAGVVAMIQERWRPEPMPTWMTCIPSWRHSRLVPDIAQRIAQQLHIPFVPCIRKVRDTQPQKLMHNSYQQAHNLARAFTIDTSLMLSGPVFLVDDMVDSRWTCTIAAALLRTAGSGPVFPVALASILAR